MPLVEIQCSRYKKLVHCSPGVDINDSCILFLHRLSIGWKYLLPRWKNTDLVERSWDDLKNHLQWQFFYMFNAVMEEQPKAFDPDYAVIRKRTPYDKNIFPALDAALLEGDKYMQNFLLSIPKDDPMVCRPPSVIFAI